MVLKKGVYLHFETHKLKTSTSQLVFFDFNYSGGTSLLHRIGDAAPAFQAKSSWCISWFTTAPKRSWWKICSGCPHGSTKVGADDELCQANEFTCVKPKSITLMGLQLPHIYAAGNCSGKNLTPIEAEIQCIATEKRDDLFGCYRLVRYSGAFQHDHLEFCCLGVASLSGDAFLSTFVLILVAICRGADQRNLRLRINAIVQAASQWGCGQTGARVTFVVCSFVVILTILYVKSCGDEAGLGDSCMRFNPKVQMWRKHLLELSKNIAFQGTVKLHVCMFSQNTAKTHMKTS